MVEIGAVADIHVPAGNRDRIGDLAERVLLAGLLIFIVHGVLALGRDVFAPFAADRPAIDHHVTTVLTNLLGIRRQHRDAVKGRTEQIPIAMVVGHVIATAAEFGDRGFLGVLPGLDLLLP